MRLTTLVTLTVLLAACGGGSDTGAPSTDTIAGTTSTGVPSLDERSSLFSYDQSAPLNLVEKKTKSQKGAEVVDVVFDAADRKVSAFLVRPKGKPKAAVLWAHCTARRRTRTGRSSLSTPSRWRKRGSSRYSRKSSSPG